MRKMKTMKDPNFEKDIRRKMGELVVPPSDTVWINVDKAINPKTRRRVLFFWWLGAGGLLMLGTFLMVNYKLHTVSFPQPANISARAKSANTDSTVDTSSLSNNIPQAGIIKVDRA